MQGLLKTLIRPDQEEDPEQTLVARAANILEVGEFQLLQLAYYEWHGHELPQDDCGRLFQAYMLHGETPGWARRYALWVIRQDEIGLIDADDPAFHRYDHDYGKPVPQGLRKFCAASLLLAVVLVGGILVSHLATKTGSSILPPYFEAEELIRKQ